ncbi:MAG: ATP-dependent DNA ligase [Thermoplasmatales archaeon B_DKE]|nr:MAG: ATP-dependent DNA ligase [Thermoplasmatales archaeon B_DKE]
MKFSEVTRSFDELSNTTKRLELGSILVELLKKAGDDLKILVYLIQGKLAPDYLGIETGVSEKIIIKALSAVSGIQETVLGKRLVKEGDIGELVESVLSEKKQASLEIRELTVKSVHESLLKLSQSKGKGSIELKINTLKSIFISGTPTDSKYIARIIEGKLRLGIADSTIVDALTLAFASKEDQQAVDTAYNFHPDIGYIAELLRKGDIETIRTICPEPLVPFKVMLAERLPNIRAIMEKMESGAAFEYKYDGLRTQIHKSGNEIKIFSRGTEDVTGQFPDIVRAMHDTFQCDTCILDGESVPYNPDTGELYPFQVVSQRRGRKYDLGEKQNEIPITVFLFDILYLNGESLAGMPYSERRIILEKTFTEGQSFKLARRLISSDEEEIKSFFNQSIDDGCEGVVAKSMGDTSIYRAGARGWLWIKLKKDYQAELSDTLDLVAVGAFGGQGRRKGRYGALLMASYNQDNDTFETICKLGSGFTDEFLISMSRTLSEETVESRPARVVSNIEPDVWLNPRMVMEIIAAEITVSPVHTCAFGLVEKSSGLAIRFPRFSGIVRDDKKPEDATTTSEILEMFLSQKKTVSD